MGDDEEGRNEYLIILIKGGGDGEGDKGFQVTR